jgi:hypothetical protein
MAYSKIASIATYHKCIKKLDEYGYISYKPSYHPRLGSQITGLPDWMFSRDLQQRYSMRPFLGYR